MDTLAIRKIVMSIMFVPMDEIIVRTVLLVLLGNPYYVSVCLHILSIVKIRNLSIHSMVIFLFVILNLLLKFQGSSKKKWLHLFTQTAPTITTTTTTTTASTPNLPFNLPSIFTCSGRTNGYYADPIHCNKFHYCGTGQYV